MTIHIDAFTAYIIIGIFAMITIVFCTTMIIVCRRLSHVRHQLEDTNRLLYFNLKSNMDNQYRNQEIMEELDEVRTNVNTLSSGLQIKLQREEEQARRKKFPKPDEVSQIMDTISDLLSIETIKRSNQKVPIAGALPDITERAIRTYPEISEEYIIDKCIVMIEDYVK